MDNLYSLLEVKAVEAETRTIYGIASTPSPDRMGDIVEPTGMKFSNPVALLWQHDHHSPVGVAYFDPPTKKGITFKAVLAKIDDPGKLQDTVEMAWQSVKSRLVRGVSIGFRALERAFMEDGGIHFLKTEIFELSLVTIPANQDATIQTIKSLDAAHRRGQHVPLVSAPIQPVQKKGTVTLIRS